MSQEQGIDSERLRAFLSKNTAIDFRIADLRDVANVDTYQWVGFEVDKEPLIKQLKSYQRLLWVVPADREDLAQKLLENGISSPMQIVNAPEADFVQTHLTLFEQNHQLAQQIYQRARALVREVARLQQPPVQPLALPNDISKPAPNLAHNTAPMDLNNLNAFLANNQTIDFRTADLLHAPNLEPYNWDGVEDGKAELLQQLKAYQRMLRVVPPEREDLAKTLLEHGIQSSLQITSTPKKAFIQDNLTIFDQDEAIAEQIYLRALTLRKAVALQYIASVQQTEPHIRTTSFVR